MIFDSKSSLLAIALAGVAVQQASAAPVNAGGRLIRPIVRPDGSLQLPNSHGPYIKTGGPIKARAVLQSDIANVHLDTTAEERHALDTLHKLGLPKLSARDVETMNSRSFWSKVKSGAEDFGDGFMDGFDAEQARPLAPEEAGKSKRTLAQIKLNAKQKQAALDALRKLGVGIKARDVDALSQRGFWDKVKGGLSDFKEGFSDGFDAEQDRPLAPEEAGKRDGFFDDLSQGLGKGFGKIKNEIDEGTDKFVQKADDIFHPPPHAEHDDAPAPVANDKRDTFWDNAGNAVGASAGWISDHTGRISLRSEDDDAEKRDTFWDNAGNAVGAGAGWVSDHVGRVDPTDLIPSKGAKKLLSRDVYDDADLLA